MNRLLIVYQLDNSCISLREIQESQAGFMKDAETLRHEDVS